MTQREAATSERRRRRRNEIKTDKEFSEKDKRSACQMVRVTEQMSDEERGSLYDSVDGQATLTRKREIVQQTL